MSENTFLLKSVPLFEGLSWNMLSTIEPHLNQVYYEKGQVIFEKGEIGSSMYIIVSGLVSVYQDQIDNPLATLRENDVLGEASLILTLPRSASAAALEDTHMFMLDQDLVYEIMAENVEIAQVLIKTIIQRFRN